MYQIIRKVIRDILGCRQYETILDCLSRKKSKIKRFIFKREFNTDDLRKSLLDLEVKEGDSIIVHCAWREFYNYIGKPEDVIDTLISIIGKNGNLAMPCYGNDLTEFNVMTTPSAAGVLSEVFRTKYPVVRSECSHFSMAIIGPDANSLAEEHKKSEFGFDEFSPYAKFLKIKNSKVLLLGLGRRPKKFSLIHVGEYAQRNNVSSCSQMFKKSYSARITNGIDDEEIIRNMVIWEKGGRLNEKTIQKIYDNAGYSFKRISNLTLTYVDAKESYEYIMEALERGVTFTYI